MRSRLGVLLFLTMLVSVGAWAQNEPLVGTWKMNLAKSKFSPGPPPKSATIAKIQAVDGGIRIVTDGLNAEGQATHTDAIVMFDDGKMYPWEATAGGKPDDTTFESMSMNKIDAYNYDVSMFGVQHVLFGKAHWTISQDGKTRTATGTGKNAQGQTTNDVTVWDKQ